MSREMDLGVACGKGSVGEKGDMLLVGLAWANNFCIYGGHQQMQQPVMPKTFHLTHAQADKQDF